jgi:chromosome segregation ATPase
VDSPKLYTPTQEDIPALTPLSHTNASNDMEEKTVLWSNVASLFLKCEQNEENLKSNMITLTRGSDEIYQELQDVKSELAQFQTDTNENDVFMKKYVRKLKKLANKKCDKVREDVSYGSFNSNIEIFAYIDKIRGEFEERIQKVENENSYLRDEIMKLHNTYDSDYETFIRREDQLISKISAAVSATECLNARMKDHEAIIIRQLGEVRNHMEQCIEVKSGDLREEFAHAISREVEYESKTSAQLVQTVNDELTDLITRSNQYHSHRYFGMVEDVKQLRDTCQTLKQSIGMVDAELSDTKETVDFLKEEVAQSSNDNYDIKEEMVTLKEDVYHELDRDYYDLKDLMKRRFKQHKKQDHKVTAIVSDEPIDGIQMIVNEYSDAANLDGPVMKDEEAQAQAQVQALRNENIIIIDQDTMMSDDDDDDQIIVTYT